MTVMIHKLKCMIHTGKGNSLEITVDKNVFMMYTLLSQ